jgi:membrane protease YdiL (CAAX protease family)
MIVCYGRNMFWLGFNKHINAKQIIVGFFLFLFVSLIAVWLHDVSKDLLTHYPGLNTTAKEMEATYNDQVNILSNMNTWGEFAMAIVIMAFFPALFEEVFFRGAVQQLLVKWWKAPLLAIIVTSILFSIIHMSIYLFISRAVMGFVLGMMYHRSRNLWVNIIAHFLNNSLVVIQMFVLSRQGKSMNTDKLDPKFPIWGGLLIVVITYALYLLFDRVSKKNRFLVEFDEQNLLENNDPVHSIASSQN